MESIYSCHRQLPSAAFYRPAETFDKSCKFKPPTFGFLPKFECVPCGMQAKVGMAGSTIYCIFSAGLSQDVSVAFLSMSKISFTSFLSCLAFSVSCAENEIKYICKNCQMYFFKLPEIFLQIAKCICPSGIPEHVQDLFHLILVLSSLLCLLCRE